MLLLLFYKTTSLGSSRRIATKEDVHTSSIHILTKKNDLYISSLRLITEKICIHSYDDRRPIYIIPSCTDKTDMYTFVWWPKTYIHHTFVYRQNRYVYIRMMTEDLYTSSLRVQTDKTDLYTFVWWPKTYIHHPFVYRQNRYVYIRMTKDLYTSYLRIQTKQICIHSYDRRPIYIIPSYTDKTDLYTFVWWQKTSIHFPFVYRQKNQICIHSYDDKRPIYIIYSYTDKTNLYTFVWWQKT